MEQLLQILRNNALNLAEHVQNMYMLGIFVKHFLCCNITLFLGNRPYIGSLKPTGKNAACI